jgi:hypothetical protein
MLSRIERELGVPNLAALLARKLLGSDLRSLLLAVFRQRTAALAPHDLLAQLSAAPLLQPSNVEARRYCDFDRAAYAAAVAFEAVELSPAGPFGAYRVLGGIDPGNVLQTTRLTDILADPTVGHALVCAQRRREPVQRHGPPLKLSGAHRVVRMQPVDEPGFTPHFRLFTLTTAGRDVGSFAFESESAREHVTAYLTLLFALAPLGYRLHDLTVELSDTAVVDAVVARAGLARQEIARAVRPHRPGSQAEFLRQKGCTLPPPVADPEHELGDLLAGLPADVRARVVAHKRAVLDELAPRFPNVRFRFDPSRLEGLGYYQGTTLRIRARPTGGDDGLAIIDGGFTDWTQRLLADRKERLLCSGIGTEAVCKLFSE